MCSNTIAPEEAFALRARRRRDTASTSHPCQAVIGVVVNLAEEDHIELANDDEPSGDEILTRRPDAAGERVVARERTSESEAARRLQLRGGGKREQQQRRQIAAKRAGADHFAQPARLAVPRPLRSRMSATKRSNR